MIPASLFRDGTPRQLSSDEEEQKRIIYERMNPRRRKFVDRLGYDVWDPFQKPNDPLDLRTDVTRRTTKQLMSEFLQSPHAAQTSNEFRQGALECALGIINRDDKALGGFAFSLWYNELLNRENTRP